MLVITSVPVAKKDNNYDIVVYDLNVDTYKKEEDIQKISLWKNLKQDCSVLNGAEENFKLFPSIEVKVFEVNLNVSIIIGLAFKINLEGSEGVI